MIILIAGASHTGKTALACVFMSYGRTEWNANKIVIVRFNQQTGVRSPVFVHQFGI